MLGVILSIYISYFDIASLLRFLHIWLPRPVGGILCLYIEDVFFKCVVNQFVEEMLAFYFISYYNLPQRLLDYQSNFEALYYSRKIGKACYFLGPMNRSPLK